MDDIDEDCLALFADPEEVGEPRQERGKSVATPSALAVAPTTPSQWSVAPTTPSQWTVAPTTPSAWSVAPLTPSAWTVAPLTPSQWTVAPSTPSQWTVAPSTPSQWAVAPLPPQTAALPPGACARSSSSSAVPVPSTAEATSVGGSSVITFAGRGRKAEVADVLQRNRRVQVAESEDDGAPKRPRSAYQHFGDALLKEGYKGNLRKTAAKWRELTDDDRQKYDDLAAADKERYQSHVKAYYGEKGQDLMSIIVQCTTDSDAKKRKALTQDDTDVAPPPKKPAVGDALADLFDGGSGDIFGEPVSSESQADIQAPQLRLDMDGNIIVDQSSLRADSSQFEANSGGKATCSGGARPYDQAYKKPKRTKWSAEEDQRFWDAISVYGSDLLLIQTLFRDKTSQQIKTKFKQEEKRNRVKMDEYIYGVHRKKFTKDLFEEHFGKIDSSKHFKPACDDAVENGEKGNGPNLPIANEVPDDPVEAPADAPPEAEVVHSPPSPQKVVNPVVEEDKNAGFDALLDLFD